MSQQRQRDLRVVVAAARARLARVAGRESLRRRGIWVVVAAAVVGAARPLYWPLNGDAPLWSGAAVALGFFVVSAMVGFAVLVLLGRRARPSELLSARAIDQALSLREVVASGFAFERDGRHGVLESMALDAAHVAVEGFRPTKHFALPRLRPRPRALALGLGLAVVATMIGSYHPALAAILASPPTSDELNAAASLEAFARELERGRGAEARDEREARDRDRDGRSEAKGSSRSKVRSDLARKARSAANAARRGDRAGAMRDLEDLRSATRDAAREAAALRAALRQIASALQVRPPSAGGAEPSGDPSGRGERSSEAARDAADAMRELARQLREREDSEGDAASPAQRELRQLAEAVARTRSLESGGGEQRELAQRLAEALSRAGEALGAGDREGAARALEEAARRAAELEAARAEAQRQLEAVARMLQAAGALGRSMQMAMAGAQGIDPGDEMSMGMAMMGMDGEGERAGAGAGAGEGAGKGMDRGALARALAARLAAMGMGGDPTGRPGTGPEGHANNWGRPGAGIPTTGAVRDRVEVSEGDQAVLAIQGMGQNAEPTKEYRNVFPSYAAQAEEAIGDEVVPAAQRQVVRRYFEAIRPGGAVQGNP